MKSFAPTACALALARKGVDELVVMQKTAIA